MRKGSDWTLEHRGKQAQPTPSPGAQDTLQEGCRWCGTTWQVHGRTCSSRGRCGATPVWAEEVGVLGLGGRGEVTEHLQGHAGAWLLLCVHPAPLARGRTG